MYVCWGGGGGCPKAVGILEDTPPLFPPLPHLAAARHLARSGTRCAALSAPAGDAPCPFRVVVLPPPRELGGGGAASRSAGGQAPPSGGRPRGRDRDKRRARGVRGTRPGAAPSPGSSSKEGTRPPQPRPRVGPRLARGRPQAAAGPAMAQLGERGGRCGVPPPPPRHLSCQVIPPASRKVPHLTGMTVAAILAIGRAACSQGQAWFE